MSSLNPPLDYTFFQRIADRQILIPPELRAYAEALPGPNPFRPLPGEPVLRMEEFLKDLFNDFQEASRGSATSVAYAQLVDVYTRVLRGTTNWLCDDHRHGAPIGRLIAMTAEQTDIVNVLTFNHDLVIENEVAKRARIRHRWCLEQGYGTFGTKLNLTAGTNAFRRHSSTCDHRSGINILKLHGSLNWYVRISGVRPTKTLLSGTRTPPQIHATRHRFVVRRLRYTLPPKPGATGRRTWYTWPVVVPPVYGKEAMIRAFVPDVWSDARKALDTADRIVIFGYSLPQMDVQAERLIQRSVAGNQRAAHVDIINRSPESAGRFATLLPLKPMRWYPNAESYLISEG